MRKAGLSIKQNLRKKSWSVVYLKKNVHEKSPSVHKEELTRGTGLSIKKNLHEKSRSIHKEKLA